MTTGRRIALLAAVLAVAVVGFIILKPDDTKKQDTVATTPGETTPQKPAPPPIPQVTVKGGKPVGGVKEIDANKGDRVQFVVQSDVADEIHVHGYDIKREVAAGTTVAIDFVADKPGIFEVELEHAALHLTSLRVS